MPKIFQSIKQAMYLQVWKGICDIYLDNINDTDKTKLITNLNKLVKTDDMIKQDHPSNYILRTLCNKFSLELEQCPNSAKKTFFLNILALLNSNICKKRTPQSNNNLSEDINIPDIFYIQDEQTRIEMLKEYFQKSKQQSKAAKQESNTNLKFKMSLILGISSMIVLSCSIYNSYTSELEL